MNANGAHLSLFYFASPPVSLTEKDPPDPGGRFARWEIITQTNPRNPKPTSEMKSLHALFHTKIG